MQNRIYNCKEKLPSLHWDNRKVPEGKTVSSRFQSVKRQIHLKEDDKLILAQVFIAPEKRRSR